MPPPGLASDHSRELGRDARPGAGTKQPSFQLQTLPGVWLSLKAVSGRARAHSTSNPSPFHLASGGPAETSLEEENVSHVRSLCLFLILLKKCPSHV